MAELKVEIPEELEREIKGFPEIVVSLAVSRLVKEEFERLARLKRIVSRSELTEEKALEISDKINESLAGRYEKLLK